MASNHGTIVEMSVFKGFKLWSLSEVIVLFWRCRRVKQWEENIALFSQVREPFKKGSRPIHSLILVRHATLLPTKNRLQNSPYFCVFKYARAVKQKVWNEAEKQRARLGRDAKNSLSPHTPYGRVRLARFARVRLLHHALPISLLILRKKPTVLQSIKTAV